ncbi:hypothetical protein FISHEDRAFT_42896, partial [Fistulina hepatica ATCC 64428]
ENDLHNLELLREEWEVGRQLCDVLKVLKDATIHFSHANVPNLAMVIPAIDKIDDVFTGIVHDMELSAGIRSAVQLEKQKLNCYYSATDASHVYHIAMILHPRHKLKYFECAAWPDEWINEAQHIPEDKFDHSYVQCMDGNPSISGSPDASRLSTPSLSLVNGGNKEVCYLLYDYNYATLSVE